MKTKFVEDYWERLEKLHAEIDQVLEVLPQAALDWKPGPDMNSIAVLVVHLAGAERYWIGDVVMGDPSNRRREQEFQTVGWSRQALSDRLSDVGAYIQNQLAGLRLQDLDDTRVSPRDGSECRVGWALLHALEHTAQHLAHIQITRQLWHLRQIA